jgi:hypothetical protein
VSTGVIDLAQAPILRVRQAYEVIAQALATTAMYGILRRLRRLGGRALIAFPRLFLLRLPVRLSRLSVAAGARPAAAIELAVEVVTALGAIHTPQRKPHGFAYALPLVALATARIIDPDRVDRLLGVVRTQEPARSRASFRSLALFTAPLNAWLIATVGRTLDTNAFPIEQENVFDAE